MEHFIRKLATTFVVHADITRIMVAPASLRLYELAFTHSSVDKNNNYEMFEQLGDLTINKFLVFYFYTRFPKLCNPFGVKIVARLRIKYGSKQVLSAIADYYEFFPKIRTAEVVTSGTRRLSLLEDVFEAYVGVTEHILDEELGRGVGWAMVYNMLEHIFDEMTICLNYTSLFDAKTRLKEVCDFHRETITYRHVAPERVEIWRGDLLLARGTSEQDAAEKAIQKFALMGKSKEIPEQYHDLE